MFILVLKFIAYILLPSVHVGEAKCVPGFILFCFRVLHVVSYLPEEAYATKHNAKFWRDIIYPSLENIFFIKLTGMTGGVMSRGKSFMARDHTSSPPESTRKHVSLNTRTYASCPVCSIHGTRTTAPEDSGVGDSAQPATELKYHFIYRFWYGYFGFYQPVMICIESFFI